MASKIYHGKPGSYKSSTAVWFDVVPALRAGRCVVTNVEGLLDIDEIQKVLGEKFPDSAQLWRFSTLNEVGHSIIARWFHWLPVGALLLIDEVQNVYSDKDRTELKEYDVKLESNASTTEVMHDLDMLPEGLRNYSLACISQIEDDGYTDDLALSERDSDGFIRYPRNIKDALMRHRKFNWDILLCTPDITKVHSLIRSVAETAVQHKSLDSLPLPYFQRRPRTFEHNAAEKGLKSQKGDVIKRRKIPLDVFKLYKSTQTGKNNKSGAGASPVESNAFRLGVVFLLSVLAYWVYFVYGKINDEETTVINGAPQAVVSSNSTPVQVVETRVSTANSGRGVQADSEIFNPEPLAEYTIFSTGYMRQSKFTRTDNSTGFSTKFNGSDYLVYFDVFQGDRLLFSTDSDNLITMGYQFKTLAECVYEITFIDKRRIVVCYQPEEEPEQDREENNESLFSGETLLASSPTRNE